MLKLEPGMLIWTWVTFFFLLWVLKKVAWKPLLSAVEEREKRIADSLKRAEEAREEAEKYLAEQQEKLAKAQDEVQKMLREGKELAEKMKEDLLAQAREEANKLVERARADISRERQQAILAIKGEIADLVIKATSKLINTTLDEKKHRELIDQYIQSLEQPRN